MRSVFYTLFCTATAMIGYTIHGNLAWSFVNFFLAPLSWVWWLVQHEVTMAIIKQTFSWML